MSIKHQLIIVAVLVVLYTLPVLITAGFYVLHIGYDTPLDLGNKMLQWFAALSIKSDTQLSLFQKIILPVVAGISALSFSNANLAAARTAGQFKSDFRLWLVLFCIAIICIGIVLQVAFTVHAGLDFTKPEATLDQAHLATYRSITNYLSSVMESMGTYMMILLGLKAQPQ